MTSRIRGILPVILGCAHLASAQPIPTPAELLGFEPCADYSLATYEEIADYFYQLDAASERITLVEIGRTEEGRTQLMAIISSAANLRDLDTYRAVATQLARAQVSPTRARELVSEGRAVVWIDFGLHSTEVGHAQTAPLLAHHVVTDDSAEMRSVRDQVILLLVPNMNPDGTTLVAEWYRRHLGTPYADAGPPQLYHRYAGHDNNRDWFMFNLRESRNVANQLYSWFPQIVYNQHQASPFPSRIFVPPFSEPTNPHIPQGVIDGIAQVGRAMANRLDREGKTGIVSRMTYDSWWNGGMRTAPAFHNMIGVMTETSHASATPALHDPATFPKTFPDGRPTLVPSPDYPKPYRGGPWHLRDSCDYMVTASLAVLEIAAAGRREFLSGIYAMGLKAIEAGRHEVYVIPQTQRDPGAALRLVDALDRGGIEIAKTLAPLSIDAAQYRAGSYLIRGSQAFRPYLTDLLNPQIYPSPARAARGHQGVRPYDITGWTLPLQMGVAVSRHVGVTSEQLASSVPVPIQHATATPSVVPVTAGYAYALDPRVNDTFRAVNRLLAVGETVHRLTTPLAVGHQRWPAGSFLVPIRDGSRGRVQASVRGLGLGVGAVDTAPTGAVTLSSPRVGIYAAWGGNPDEGWTRFVLDQFGFAYERLRDHDLHREVLDSLDVIVLPDATYAQMVNGLPRGAAPPAYTGGMTRQGVRALRAFVARGGTLVALDSASALPIRGFGLRVRARSPESAEPRVSAPGTLLALDVDPAHPVAYGMPRRATAFFADSPLLELAPVDGPRAGVTVAARYPAADLLQSGWLAGERGLAGRPAVVEALLGSGRVILIGFRPQHRGQSHVTYKLLFNALYRGVSRPAISVRTSP